MIALARKTIVHEWRRFVPAVLAVGFAGLLLTVQAALMLGIFGSAAVYVTASSGDLWAGYPGTQSVNFGRDIDPAVEMRLRMDPGVADVEPYLWVEGDWRNDARSGGGVSVYVSGIGTDADALMFSRILPPAVRRLMRQPGAVIVDRSDLDQLSTPVGGQAWVNGHRVQIVAALDGLRALGGVNVLASMATARELRAGESSAGVTYFVARISRADQADLIKSRLAGSTTFGAFEVWTAAEFARRSQLYWMFDTGAGIAVLFMAGIVCLVGAVVTSQSLMAVVAASAREYAMLNALGASVGALRRIVVEQACWVGCIGLAVSGLFCSLLLWLAARYGVPVGMDAAMALACAALVLGLALISGLIAVRGLVRADPAMLLR
ncbi:putative ABC transport system permease protein [Variovorax boronicumulans]|uniref:ABC transporter permease n=1 Tax=Variovorax boronicumulans TaxID=436515 RepID=UPI00159D2C51|nr:ABC transporter permease [Variovorax boronicumulans]MDQ0012932.1 putative ABC transport system permease protein [Variovorax boronicumulans]